MSSRTRFPQPGDSWTYRLLEPQGGERPAEVRYVVKVAATSEGNIQDEVSRDGAPATERTHFRGNYLVAQVVSVFSPYLAVFEDLTPGGALRPITEHDDLCFFRYHCRSEGRVVGRESVELPAGRFEAIKVTIEQTWSPQSSFQGRGVRTLTIWYSPQVKRAVKFSSRSSGFSRSPFHADFDLELMSYQLK